MNSDASKKLADLGGQVPEAVLVPRRKADEDESRAAGLADAGLVEQRINRLRRIADEMRDLPAREALWHYARSVGEMHWEIENSMQESVEQRWLAENSDALESSNAFVEQHRLPLPP